MSGYYGWSKSNNAVDAENNGEYPASRIAQKLKLPVRFVKEYCDWAKTGWHHVSSWYRECDYYNIDDIQQWMESENEEPNASFANAMAEYKAKRSMNKKQIFNNCRVEWLEWYGSRKHPECIEYDKNDCSVEYNGSSTFKITHNSGMKMIKRMNTNGFKINGISPESFLHQKSIMRQERIA